MTNSGVRKRTFTGCITCRQRRSKCDEKRPVCSSCSTLGIKCQGYEPKLVWVTDEREYSQERRSHRGAVYRYPLFSESRRQALVSKLAKSLERQSLTNAINDVDEWEPPEESGNADSSLTRGPFSVFAIDQEACSKNTPSSSSTVETSTSESVHSRVNKSDDSHTAADVRVSSNHDWKLPFDQDLGGLLDEHIGGANDTSPMLTLSPHKASIDFYNTDFASVFPPGSPKLFMQGPSPELWDYYSSTLSVPFSPSSLALDQASDVDGLRSQMEPLLRHYKERVLEPAAELRQWRRSPWQILFWPCALETYGEMKLWNTAPHARSAVLHAILANSAFHLHTTEQSDGKWHDFGMKYQNKAKKLLFQALQDEILGVAKAKYKELLMAILSVAMVSLFAKPEAFKGYLLAAEYVIRHRGLHKQHSVKARTLQHMYTHLRILTEGTCTFADCVNEFAGLNHNAVAPAVLPKFEIVDNLQTDQLNPGATSAPSHDIHFRAQRQHEDILYSSIYGVPESLMSLLSRIVACANEKDKATTGSSENVVISPSLQKHLQALELEMWSWNVPIGPVRPHSGENNLYTFEERNSTVDITLSRAMHQAVIIYFYRRVYDTDAMVLQEQVRKCLDDLEPCMGQKAGDQDFATSIAWATYIAACGAVTPDLRQRALGYLDKIDSHGVMLTPKPVAQISRFWQRRLERGLFSPAEYGIPVGTAA